MELDISTDINDTRTVYTLVIERRDLVSTRFTEHEKRLFDTCEKSDKISDKLLALKIIATEIELEHCKQNV